MTLNYFIALLTAAALTASPTSSAIPTDLYEANAPSNVVQRVPTHPQKVRIDSHGIETTALSAIVVDAGSGDVLFAKEATVTRPIASLTKLVTAMVLVDKGLVTEEALTIHNSDIEPIGRHWLEHGERLMRRHAFDLMLTQSVNEIANAFAREYEGGTDAFVAAMNEKSRILRLEQAFFVDASGIRAENRASALDVARILRSALAYPEIREATQWSAGSVRTLDGRTFRAERTNLLLESYLNEKPYQIVVGKTGSLPEAGYCLGQVTEHPDGQQVLTVVLGSTDHFGRFQEVKALTAWAFDAFTWNP